MAENRDSFEAMVIPKGARITATGGGEIGLDVQGDIILQESQRGLTSLVSHHGSILVDDKVTVRSHSIRAKHMIRIRGKLETNEIRAASISLEGGGLSCGEINTGRLDAVNGNLDVRSIRARAVKIEGGRVEIGAIVSDSIRLGKKVQGAILISSASERLYDDSVQIKGGFESDVELLGYLLKYRHQVMSDRVLQELQSREDGRELQRFLLREAREGAAPGAPRDDSATGVGESQDAHSRDEEGATEPVSAAVTKRLRHYAEELSGVFADKNSVPTVLKLLISTLRQGDLNTLRTMFQRWAKSLEGDQGQLPPEALGVLKGIREYVAGGA